MKIEINVKDVLPDFNQDILDAKIPRPAGEHWEFLRVDFAVLLIDKGQIHAREELDIWSHIRVLRATGDLETVDAVLVDCLRDYIAIRG